ncbi:hypothetical protein IAE19_07305 [Acinetobacter sp. S40]|uniref:hypothetical protein n=1 Tax=unclassified Acinetobacter TaxID=196816 RepID=UPI00190D084F|nr:MULTISPECIES: hypothetical protein [unclassified Acinetobacter]MBJ9985252.1 hypothetical protein [Acinetobacter sp. S40]MBK0065278.1 hypothetical protein [Acinetobacter sp. S55]MBK0067116.1 hypothetical protein [Acinetobacter sp. S54]
MACPIFLHELSIEQLQQMFQEDIDPTIKSEQLYFQHIPTTIYYLAIKINSGAGIVACIVEGKSAAFVGSHLENGDEIIDSPNKSVAINIFKGDKAPEGFLVKQEGINHG